MSTARTSRKWYWIGALLIMLIAFRIALPSIVTNYVNKVLANIEGYRGSIYDVDIHLYRGAYSIDSLKIFKLDGNKEVPFVDIPVTDLSVEWSALFDGDIVGEIIFESPNLNFIGGDADSVAESASNSGNQSGENVDWTEPIKNLIPLQINRMEINNGRVSYHDFTTTPRVGVSLENLQAIATNLNNAKDNEDRLPSTISATATSIGGGRLTVDVGINVLKEIPDMDLNLKFEQVDMPAFNDFFMAYAGVDIERGAFNLYSEMTIDNGAIAGYVKPIAVDIKVVDWKNDKQRPLNLIWQSLVGFVAEVFENQKEHQFATKVPLQGNLKDVNAGVWPTVWNIFRNAFVQAFDRNTDNSVEFDQLASELKEAADDKTKIEARREERRQRKEEKKERKAKRQQTSKPG